MHHAYCFAGVPGSAGRIGAISGNPAFGVLVVEFVAGAGVVAAGATGAVVGIVVAPAGAGTGVAVLAGEIVVEAGDVAAGLPIVSMIERD